MHAYKKKIILAISIILLLLVAASALGAGALTSNNLLPEGLVMEEGYQPGFGAPVGMVQLVQGEVVIIHKGSLIGYRAQNNLSIFKGDTIITLDKGRIRISLNDGSIMTLASKTKLEVNRSLYDPVKKTRSTFLGLNLGKARFLVKKLFEKKQADFKVKTLTAVVGVRGTKLLLLTGFKPPLPDEPPKPFTTVATLDEKSLVNVVPLEQLQTGFPVEEISLGPLETVDVVMGIQSKPKSITIEEAEQLEKDDFVPDSDAQVPVIAVQMQQQDEEESTSPDTEEADDKPKTPAAKVVVKTPSPASPPPVFSILLLVDPNLALQTVDTIPVPDVTGGGLLKDFDIENTIKGVQTEIAEDVKKVEITGDPLPLPPPPPPSLN